MEKNRKETAPGKGINLEKDQEKEIRQEKEITNEEGSQGAGDNAGKSIAGSEGIAEAGCSIS